MPPSYGADRVKFTVFSGKLGRNQLRPGMPRTAACRNSANFANRATCTCRRNPRNLPASSGRGPGPKRGIDRALLVFSENRLPASRKRRRWNAIRKRMKQRNLMPRPDRRTRPTAANLFIRIGNRKKISGAESASPFRWGEGRLRPRD